MQIEVGRLVSPDFVQALRNLSAISFPTLNENLALARLMRNVQEAGLAFEKMRKAMVEKYGEPQLDGSVKIGAQRMLELRPELVKLENELIDLPDVRFKMPTGANLCARDLFVLEPFLDLGAP